MTNWSFEHVAETRAALRTIVSDPAYGATALSNVRIMSEVLPGLLRGARLERSVLVTAATESLASTMLKHVSDGMNPSLAVRLSANFLATISPVPLEACYWVAAELALALGLITVEEADALAATGAAALIESPQGQGDVAGEGRPSKPAPPDTIGSLVPDSDSDAVTDLPPGHEEGVGAEAGREASQSREPGSGDSRWGSQGAQPQTGVGFDSPENGGYGGWQTGVGAQQPAGGQPAGPAGWQPQGVQPVPQYGQPGTGQPATGQPGSAVCSLARSQRRSGSPAGAAGYGAWPGAAEPGPGYVGQPVQPDPEDWVSRAVRDAVRPGLLAFNTPQEMQQGRIERVEVGVARSPELRDALTAGFRGRGLPEVVHVNTSPIMGVELRGSSFEIVGYSPPEQLVADQARWQFDVTPVRSGSQTLTLCVSLRIDSPFAPGGRIAVPVLERDIRIHVDVVYGTRRFVAGNWQWLVGTAVGLGGGIAAWIALVH